jgi:hypothetical protein
MGIVDDMYRKIMGQKREWQVAIVDDVRGLAIRIARHELGLVGRDEPPIDEDHAADVLDASGLSEREFRACVETCKRRFGWSQLAAELPKRAASLAEAERRYRDADVEEAARHSAALQRIAALRESDRQKRLKHEAALEAHGNLAAGALVSPEEHELVAEQASLQKLARRLRVALDANAPPALAGAAYMVDKNPAGLLRVAQRDLAQLGKAGVERPGRRDALRNTIAAATQAVEAATRELSGVEKDIAALQSRATKLAADRLDPRNFVLPRAKTSRDQQAKQLAGSLGFGPER